MTSQSADQHVSKNRVLQARIAELEQQVARERDLRNTAEQLSSQRGEALAALHQSTLALMHNLDVSDVLKTIVTSAAQLVNTPHGFLYLVNEQEHVLETKLGIGYHDGYVGFRLGYGEGLSGKVWQTGQPVIIENYGTWSERVTALQPPSFHSIVGVPLLRHHEVTGVIGLSFDDGRIPNAGTIDLLSSFAQLASIALENARLYTAAQHEITERQHTEEALRQSEQLLRALYMTTHRQAQELVLLGQVRAALAREIDLPAVFQTVVEAVAHVLGYTHVSLYTLEHDTLILRHQVGYHSVIERVPVASGISGRVVRTGQPLLVKDVRSDPDFLAAIEGIVSQVCVPLFDDQRAIGVINVESNHGAQLGEDDLRVIIVLAEHVGIAIYRARLFGAVQRRAQELEALRVTMTEISANLDLDTLLRAILERQVALLSATAGELGLYDAERIMLHVVASHNMDRDSSGTWLKLEEGMMGQVARTRLPLVVPNYNMWAGRSAHYQDIGPMTALAVPMLAGDHLVGVLAVGDTHLDRVFAEDDLRLLSLFAQQATIAIQNGRLFADIQQLATIDPLTGLANRRAFYAMAQHEFERIQRSGHYLAALMIDVDDFKRINDQHGHAVGDRVLHQIGRRCREALRSVDLIGRYGGEEVAIVLPDADQYAAQQVAQRIRLLLADNIDADVASITVSVGVAVYQPPEAIDLDILIDRADRAQYIAKHTGKDRVVVWGSASIEADGLAH